MQEGNRGKALHLWVGIAISVACLVAIFLLIDPAEILKAIRNANLRYASLIVLGLILFLVLRAVRWRFILDNNAPWRTVFHIQNIGYLLTFILPFRLGDVARAVLIGNVPPVTLPQGVSTMIVERVLDLLFIVALLPFTLASVDTLTPTFRTAARISGVLALVAIAVLIVAANQRQRAVRVARAILQRVPFLDTERWERHFGQLLLGLKSLTDLKNGLILAILSVLIWIPIIAAYYAGMLAVNLQPTLAMAAFVVCAAALSVTAPSSPGQVGVFHAGVTFALVQILDQPQATSASFAFLYHALNFATVIIVGLVGVYGIGSTLGRLMDTARQLMRRDETRVNV